MGTQFQLGKMEKRKVPEMDGGDGCTTMQMSMCNACEVLKNN